MSHVGKGLVVVMSTLLAELAGAFVLVSSVATTGSGGLGAVAVGAPEIVVFLLLPAAVAGIVSMGLHRPKRAS